MKKQGKPVRPGDIAKITKLDGKEVSTIIKNLKNQGKIVFSQTMFLRTGLIEQPFSLTTHSIGSKEVL